MTKRSDVTLSTGDGERLQAELVVPEHCRAAMVVTHPNPVMGGDMYTPVPAAMFQALPQLGCAGLRFNFRGVGSSTGAHDKGDAERLDVSAAIDTLAEAAPDVPLLIGGWSFGTDVALAVDDDRIAGWLLAAAPMVVHQPTTMAARTAAAPKRFLVPEHDHLAPPDVLARHLVDWTNADTVVIPGVDHFFGGLMEPIVTELEQFISEIAPH